MMKERRLEQPEGWGDSLIRVVHTNPEQSRITFAQGLTSKTVNPGKSPRRRRCWMLQRMYNVSSELLELRFLEFHSMYGSGLDLATSKVACNLEAAGRWLAWLLGPVPLCTLSPAFCFLCWLWATVISSAPASCLCWQVPALSGGHRSYGGWQSERQPQKPFGSLSSTSPIWVLVFLSFVSHADINIHLSEV